MTCALSPPLRDPPAVTTAAAPSLRFRLPGSWVALDPRDADTAHAHSARIAREIIGPADDASAAAREASAHLLLMCREIAPGVPTPVAISVHTPVEVTPTVGTAPEAVMRAFTASLPHTAECDLETATRTDAAGSAREHDDAVG